MPTAAAFALADPPPPPARTAASAPPAATVVTLPRKRGPKTPEGKARSRQNALRHGLRARLLPLPPTGEAATHFHELADGLRRSYRPEDAAEAELVEAIAVAMWQEVKADRLEAEALAALAGGDGRPFHGAVLLEAPENRATLHTVLRYQATASNAVGRGMRLFFAHRRARRDGLLAGELAAAADATDCTNELPRPTAGPAPAHQSGPRHRPPPPRPSPAARERGQGTPRPPPSLSLNEGGPGWGLRLHPRPDAGTPGRPTPATPPAPRGESGGPVGPATPPRPRHPAAGAGW
jgi:hypothetical protein